jgi:serine/threonine protein kinase
MRGRTQAVLVDFGLAGRHVRPGCGTSAYGAPEIWVNLPGPINPTPMAADMYGFGCLAYEVLTGETLFDAPNEVALVTAHLMHDGLPPPVKRLADRPATAGIAAVLRSCLRKTPDARARPNDVRFELNKVGTSIASRRWPVPV